MPTFRIVPAIFERFPTLRIGLLIVKNARNDTSSPEIATLLRAAESRVRSAFADPEQLKTHPTIAAWQDVHRAFGSNPNQFPSSIHALLKRVAKGGQLPAISPLVDLYNVLSLKYIVPVGGEDLDRCSGDIQLTFADGTESFTALGEEANDPPLVGEVIYKDDTGVLCRRFNWREAARTCLTEKTKNAVLVMEAAAPMTDEDLMKALGELKVLTTKFCGGESRIEILNAGKGSIEL